MMNTLVEAIRLLQLDVTLNDNVKAKPLLSDLFNMYKVTGEKPIAFVNNQITSEEYEILMEVKNRLAA